MPTSEWVLTDSLAGLGEGDAITRLAHDRSRTPSSNPEFCLPMMKTRRSAQVSTGRVSA
jgi:hypothetical protein